MSPKPEYDSVHVNAEFHDQSPTTTAGRAAETEATRPDRGRVPHTHGPRRSDGASGQLVGAGCWPRRAWRARRRRASLAAGAGEHRRTWAAGSTDWPSCGSWCTDSRRSSPKRSTETLNVEASTPWRLAQRLDGRQGARVVAAEDEHELRRVTGYDGLERVGDRREAGGVPAGYVGGGGQRAADLPLDGLAGDVQDDGAAGLLVEREQIDAGQPARSRPGEGWEGPAPARKRARRRRSAPAAPRDQGCSP